MISASSAIVVKIVIDLLYLGVLGCCYVWPIFIYDTDFDIGILQIKYNFHSDGLSAYVQCKFSEFDDHLCISSFSPTKSVCSKLDQFKTAGEIFLIITAFSGTLTIYSMLNLIGKIFYCSARGCLHLDFTHYLPLPLYLITFGIYCLVCELESISYSVHIGIFSLFLCAFISVFNFIFYCCYKNLINQTTEPQKETVYKPKLIETDKDQELEISNPSVISKPASNK